MASNEDYDMNAPPYAPFFGVMGVTAAMSFCGLRLSKPKPEKPPKQTNAQKCKAYAERQKADPTSLWQDRRHDAYTKWKEALTPQQKDDLREKARIRQRNRRAKLQKKKSESKPAGQPKVKCLTRKQSQVEADKREQARLRQQKRRASMTPQKKRRMNERRRQMYHSKKKSETNEETKTKKTKITLKSLLKGVHNSLKRGRSKLSLMKLDFVKKILSKKSPCPSSTSTHNLYHRKTVHYSNCIESFYDKNAVDFPGQRGASQPKKVLTKPTVELFREFRKAHPAVKTSLTTFKRRRPKNILLSSSNKFIQCLCENCTNAMLIVDVINPFLSDRSRRGCEKIRSVDDLVNRTLCVNSTRYCWERRCSQCGVAPLIQDIKKELGQNINQTRKWSRWGKTDKSPRDLIFKTTPVSEALDVLEGDLACLALHLKRANWQRQQYQKLRESLPRKHAMCTVDFAENYLCKFQNEVQSAHWSYNQVTVHPCVFFYRCTKPDCFKTITEYLICISDDLKHDNAFTKCVIDQCLSHMAAKGNVCFHLYSDGCGSQYKSRYTFKDLVDLQEAHPDIKIDRHFLDQVMGKAFVTPLEEQ